MLPSAIFWRVKPPSKTAYTFIRYWPGNTPPPPDEWRYTGQYPTYHIYIPRGEEVGLHKLQAISFTWWGMDSNWFMYSFKDAPDFYVVFNPWNDDEWPDIYDRDVFMPTLTLTKKQVEEYSLGTQTTTYNRSDWSNTIVTKTYELHSGKKQVFETVMDFIKGETSAVAASRTLAESANGMLEGRWPTQEDWDAYRNNPSDPKLHPYAGGTNPSDWTSVLDIVKKWQAGSKAKVKYAQCFVYGALLNAFLRSADIPSRSVTTWDSYSPLSGAIWNFHVWDEAWLPLHNGVDGWSAVDATYKVGPASRDDVRKKAFAKNYNVKWIHDEVNYEPASHVYTYNPDTGLIDVREQYFSTGGKPSTDRLPTADLALTSEAEVALGAPIMVTAWVTNTAGITQTFNLHFALEFWPFELSGGADLEETPPTPTMVFSDTWGVLVAAGQVYSRTLDLGFDIYRRSGGFLALLEASAAGITETTTLGVSVQGLPLSLAVPATLNVGQPGEATLAVTNPLTVSLQNLVLALLLPSDFTITGTTIITLPTLAPGTVYTLSAQFAPGESGNRLLAGLADSLEVGDSRVERILNVPRDAQLVSLLQVPNKVAVGVTVPIVGRIINAGDKVASATRVTLTLAAGLTSPDPPVLFLGDIPAGVERVITWTVTIGNPGYHSLRLSAADAQGRGATDVALLPASSYDHTLKLTAQSLIVSKLITSALILTLTNEGNAEDQVNVSIFVDNPNITVTMTSNGIPVGAEALSVPPQSSRNLTLTISPLNQAEGTVFIFAVSKLDPTAGSEAQVYVCLPYMIYFPRIGWDP